MEKQAVPQPTVYERKLIRIVRRLPPERVSQVIDFAQFLEYQLAEIHAGDIPDQDESEEEILADSDRWDALLDTEESQHLLEKMADEAWADIRAGRARPMVFTAEGEIAPG